MAPASAAPADGGGWQLSAAAARAWRAARAPLKAAPEPLPVAALDRISAQRTLFTIRQCAEPAAARQLSTAWLQALQLAQIASERCVTGLCRRRRQCRALACRRSRRQQPPHSTAVARSRCR